MRNLLITQSSRTPRDAFLSKHQSQSHFIFLKPEIDKSVQADSTARNASLMGSISGSQSGSGKTQGAFGMMVSDQAST